ncbi:polysaccharide deacetylase family protein [Brevibacillus massiliensis]|uniref:polysaccharide deacetylase family protein n=1 Tax=Brevibacillus massiliensis TaxID=1118054 RepID=UPI000307E3B2|nr:polysaccharide deacetylase [Brevibacillus massiliensis]
MQVTGKVKIPNGKRVAVNIGCDFDAASVWMGSIKRSSPVYLSRGEFGAEVGAPRLLKLFDKYQIKTTWFIPGHTVDTHTDVCKEVFARGHEIGHHGYVHEDITNLSYEEEVKILEMGLESLAKIGIKPSGYRSPAWDYSPNTLSILEKYGFRYDSSLMGNDIYPYRPRPVLEVNMDKANVFGPPSSIVEFPVSWFLDDFPTQEFVLGFLEGMRSTQEVFERWKAIFDYACDQEDGACFILTLHPQTSGRAHMLPMLERLIQHMSEKGAWFATLDEIRNAYYEEN